MMRQVERCPVARMMNPTQNTAVSNNKDFLRPITSLTNPAKQADNKCPKTQLLAEENKFCMHFC